MLTLNLNGNVVSTASLAKAAKAVGPVSVTMSEDIRTRLRSARSVVETFAAGDAPVYGLNTGLGPNVGLRIGPDAVTAFQEQLLRGRETGVGASLSITICRAAFLARMVGLAQGVSGIAPTILDLMMQMAAHDIWPCIPEYGSIGDSDLTQNASLGMAIIGEGTVWHAGQQRSAAAAFSNAGLTPATLGPKDGMALINHSCVSTALGALAIDDAREALTTARGAAALSAEGYAMNPAIFAPHINELRPAAGQAEAAAWFLWALEGAEITQPGSPRAIQDALSFRLMASGFGVAQEALKRAAVAVDGELNGASDSPAVFADDDAMASTPNFYSLSLALSLEGLNLAMAHVAQAASQRIIKLMTPHLSGLPKHLSPNEGTSAGYLPMQKTVASIMADIRRNAQPVSLHDTVVSDMVEDLAPQTPLTAKMAIEQARLIRLVAGIEAMVAAQAVDLRQLACMGRVAGVLQAAIRDRVPMLQEDRACGSDVDAVLQALSADDVLALLADGPAL